MPIPPSLPHAPEDRGRRVLLVDAYPDDPATSNQLLFGPLGALKLNACIRQRCHNVETHIVHWSTFCRTNRETVFESLLSVFRPAIVGISAFSRAMPSSLRVARMVRDFDARVPIILGGSHPTACPDGIAVHPELDYYVAGDADRAGPELIDGLLARSTNLEPIPNIVFRRDGTIVRSPTTQISVFDESPPIDWTDIDLNPFLDTHASFTPPTELIFDRGQLIPYLASRGCTYRCAFCERTDGTTFRHHSPQRVVADLERLGELFGGDYFGFLDNHIHLNRRWFGSLLDQLRHHLPSAHFSCGVMGDKLDEELIDRMLAAGFRTIHCFPESGSQRILDLMNKQIRIERLISNMEYASRQGAVVYGHFIVGWPSETEVEAEQTVALAEESLFDFVTINQLVYLAAASVYEHVARLGIEPDTPEYFQQLDSPPCLATYDKDQCLAYCNRGKALNLLKVTDRRTRQKLADLGIRARIAVQFEPPEPPVETAPQVAAATDEVTEPQQQQAEGTAPADTRLEDYLGERLSAPDYETEAIEAIEGNPPRLRIDLRGPEGTHVLVWLKAKRDGPHLGQTRFFGISYGGRTLGSRQAAILSSFVRQLRRWESHDVAQRLDLPDKIEAML